MPDWYRCTEWNEQTEAEFFRRLKRARQQKPQYLAIQAMTLVGTGRPDLAAIALKLIDLLAQERPDFISERRGLLAKAEALLILDRSDEAFQAYEEAIAARRAQPNFIDDSWLAYPLAIARRGARDRYQRALEILGEFVTPSGLALPIEQFRYFATVAIISADQGDSAGASRWAKNALAAVPKKGPFSRHPDAGVVGTTYAELQNELEKLVID